MALNETDLITVVEELRLKGYTDTFTIENNTLISEKLKMAFKEKDFIIEGGYLFDIDEQPFDTQYLFTVHIPAQGLRGLLIDLLGMYYYMEEQPITEVLRKTPLLTYLFDDKSTHLKYGLRKITPFDYNVDKSRYVLRVGFPDFPVCPAGTAFSMLGFDQQKKEYVWLTTKILKDKSLKRVQYDPLSK